MADIQANIGIGVDTSQALAAIRQLQREISVFHTLMAKGGAAAAAKSMAMQQGLINTINETGKFSASMTRISSSTESFTNALEKNKLSMGQYFRYAGGASKTFGKAFSREFNTINRVAQERVKDLQTQYISMGRDANGALQSIKVRPLALDMDNLGTKVQLAAQKQQIFNQLMKQGTTNLLNFGKNTQWAGRQLMVGFTIPLTIFGALAAKEFQKLEEQAVRFRRVYGDMFTTDADTEKALSNVRELAEEFTKYGIAVEKTIGLAAKVAQMGNVGEDLTSQVTQATRLAVLGGLEQEEALDTTISLTNAFGIAAEDLAGKIAFLNAAENQTILSIEDFNEAIPKAGSVVQQLGGNVEDLAFFLTAMREGGINASQGANALKTSLARLIAPTEVAKKEMAAFGIDIVGIVERNAGNLRQTVIELGQQLDTLDPLNRARAIEQLFGKFQFARMSTMFQNIAKEGSQANRVLELTTNSMEELAIIAERELKAVEESPAFKLQKQMEQLKASLAPIGEEFIKAVGPLIEFGTKLLKSFNNLGDGGKQFIVILTTVAGVVAPAALMAFGLIANGVANLLKFFLFLGNAFGRLSGQSTMLGGQTEYMTQQQIEAAAVAASLGQSHSNLTQIFTAEASAISRLVAQYRSAIAAQRQLSIGQTARGVAARGGARPPGFAKGGIIRGPGTGTSDSIFAMISNGEAVIPAAMVKKYGPVVEQIISDNVPGYAQSNVENLQLPGTGQPAFNNITGKALSALETEIAKRASAFGISIEEAGNQLSGTLKNVAATTAKALSENEEFAKAKQERVRASQSGLQESHLGPEGKKLSSTEFSKLAPNRSDVAASARLESITGKKYLVDQKHALTRKLPGYINQPAGLDPSQMAQVMKKPGGQVGVPAEDVSGYMLGQSDEEVLQAYDKAFENAGADSGDPELQADVIKYDRKIAELLQDRAGKRMVDTAEHLAAIPADKQGDYFTLEDVEAEAAQALPPGSRGAEFRETALATTREGRRSKATVRAIATDFEALTPEQKAQFPEAEQQAVSTLSGRAKKNLRSDFELGAKDKKASRTALGIDTSETQEIGQNIVDSTANAMNAAAEASSPAKRFIRIGENIVNSTAMGMEGEAAEQAGKPPLPGNLAAPKPPVTSGYTPSRAERLRARFNDSAIGQGIGRKLSGITGNALTDSQGNVTYDPGAVAGGVAPVRVVNEVEFDPALQNAMETGSIESENLADTLAQQQSSVQDNTDTVAEKARQEKAALKESKRQNRQARAGKALAGLGTLTMAAGMATQVEGRVGEIAQQVVGPMAALSGIAPMLMALPAPIAALVAVIGTGIVAWMAYNKAIKDTARETYELQRALGSSKEAIQSFAEFSGRVTQTELFERQQQERFNPFQIAAGKSTFGENFAGDEAGQALVGNIRTSLTELGRDQTVTSIFLQLGQAVGEGALSIPEARSIATELGDQIGDMSFGMEVNANLMRLLGPGGEDLTAGDRLTILADIREDRQRSRAEMDLEYRPTGYGEAFVSEMDKRTQMENEAGGIFGIGAILNPDYWASYFKSFTGIAAAEENMAQLSTILAQGVNDADAFAADMAAIEASYSESLAKAYSMDDEYEIDRLEAERKDAQDKVLKDRGQAQQQVLAELTKDTDKARIAMTEALKVDFADDQAALNQYTDALKQIQGLGLEDAKSLELEYMLTSGDMPFQTAVAIVKNYENLPAVSTKIMEIQTNFGDLSGEASGLFNIFKSIDEGLAEEFVLQLDTTDLAEYQRQIEAFGAISRIQGLFPEGEEILLDVALKDPKVLDRILENISKLEAVDNSQITLDFIASTFGDEALAAAEAIWSDIPTEDRKDALYSILTALDLELGDGFGDLFESLKGQTIAGVKIEEPGDILSLIGARTAGVAAGNRSLDQGEDEPGPVGDGGSEPQVDGLITKLRDLRDATVSMKKGWEGMQETLSSIFAGGANQMGMFSGLEKQIRNLGIGEGLIAQIVGMDPDEYEKRKNELFEFDGLGNIVKAKGALLNMNEAFNAVAIGEYVNGQEQFIQKTKDQMSAIRILTSNGMSLADAYDAVQDAALAAAIAQGASREEIEEILRITALAKELEEDLEEQRERSRISEAVRKTNEEFSNQVAILQKLSKAQGQYSDEQVKAIMGDSDLQKLFLDPSIDPKALEAALRNAEEKANLEVQIAIAEGREDELFGQYLTEVNDYFTREEAVIGVNFEMDTADESKIIEDAQRQIDAIQYQLDDYNAELEQISWSEEDINKKYDKRVEALDEIADANKKIADQQKAQLDIADALSKGDIAAAARATAELRSQQASDAQQSQKEQLDRAREAELKQLTGPSGMTREQLEDAITSLERQVFQLEETALEPAQERVRLAEITRDLAIEQLELNGMTRDEFDQIAASTNLAALNMEDMVKSAEKLVAMGEFIRTGTKPANWEELFPMPKAAPAPAPSSSGGGGGGGGGGGSKGDWFDPGTGTTIAKAAQDAGFGSNWQEYYNQQRGGPGGIDQRARPMAMGGLAKKSRSGPPLQMAMGGKVSKYANGGMIIPKRMAMGGYSMGSDIVPAILTPGEFVVRRPAVSAFGVDNLEKINRGTYNDGSVYNYNLAVNVKSDSDPNRIARAVITNIKSIENQRIRGNKL